MLKEELEKLKDELRRKTGLGDMEITDDQMIMINDLMRDLPDKEKSIAKIHEIIGEITGFKGFTMHEALDNSDVDNIIDQLKDILDKEADE